MKSSTIVPENTSIETVPAESCEVSWCTALHDWRDADERCHIGDTDTLATFTAGRVDEPSSARVSLEQGAEDAEPRTYVEIFVAASCSRTELLSFADDLQALASKLRAEAVASPIATSGAGLRTLREMASLTVADLAARTGYGANYLTRIESGEATASIPLLVDLSLVIAGHLKSSAVV